MDFELNDTERMLADSLARFEEQAIGWDADRQWAHSREMGWHCASVPEDQGGFGLGLNGPFLIAESFGAALSPVLWQSFAVLPAIALGALAEADDSGPLDAFLGGERSFCMLAGTGTTTAEGACVLRKPQDLEADVYLALLPVGEGRVLALIEAGDLPAPVSEESWIDGRRMAEVAIKPSTHAGVPVSADLAARLRVAAEVTAAADHLGAMRQLFDQTLEYTKTRNQFGRALSAFQALQHRLVDMSIALEETRALVMAAAMAASQNHEDSARLASAAWSKARAAGQKVGEEAIQLHGGIGMTEECQVGTYVKRMMRNAPVIAAA